MRQYHTLIVKSLEPYNSDEWTIEFGDYSKAFVQQEMLYQIETARNNQERFKFKIITTNEDQQSVQAAVDKLNH